MRMMRMRTYKVKKAKAASRLRKVQVREEKNKFEGKRLLLRTEVKLDFEDRGWLSRGGPRTVKTSRGRSTMTFSPCRWTARWKPSLSLRRTLLRTRFNISFTCFKNYR